MNKVTCIYLGLVFSISWLIDVLIFINKNNAFVVSIGLPLVMLVPGFIAILCQVLILKKPVKKMGFYMGKTWTYFFAYLLPILYVAVSSTLSYFMGWANFDWHLQIINSQLPHGVAFDPSIFRMQLLIGSLTWVVPVNLIFSLSEELGWRGFLLYQLGKFGHNKSVFFTNIIWGIWHAPLILTGLNYPEHPVAGIMWMICFTVLFGWILCWIKMRGQSILPLALMHAVLNSQGRGLFPLVFQVRNTLIGGPMGVIGLTILACIVLVLSLYSQTKSQVSR